MRQRLEFFCAPKTGSKKKIATKPEVHFLKKPKIIPFYCSTFPGLSRTKKIHLDLCRFLKGCFFEGKSRWSFFTWSSEFSYVKCGQIHLFFKVSIFCNVSRGFFSSSKWRTNFFFSCAKDRKFFSSVWRTNKNFKKIALFYPFFHCFLQFFMTPNFLSPGLWRTKTKEKPDDRFLKVCAPKTGKIPLGFTLNLEKKMQTIQGGLPKKCAK